MSINRMVGRLMLIVALFLVCQAQAAAAGLEMKSGANKLVISPSGYIESIVIGGKKADLVRPAQIPGLFRLHVPLEDFESQIIEAKATAPHITESPDGVRIFYPKLNSSRGPLDISVLVRVKAAADGGFELTCDVTNRTSHNIPQVFFPWIGGVAQMRESADKVTFPRSKFYPWKAWKSERRKPRLMESLSRPYHAVNYGHPANAGMKWMDFGNDDLGLTLYSEDKTAKAQYMLVSVEKSGDKQLDLAWYFYPFVAPSGEWHSPVFVLYPHAGDWHQGALKFREFTKSAFKELPPCPQKDESLGVYSLWISWHYQDWQNVKYKFKDIPAIAREAHQAGFNELMLARATALDFCLPHVVREPLGTEEELKAAVEQCAKAGLNARLFLTCRLIRPETIGPGDNPDEYFMQNVAGQRIGDNWTYDPTMIPHRNIRQIGSRAAYYACAGSSSWRRAFWSNYKHITEDWAFKGFLFDQAHVITDGLLCFNPLHKHRPDEELQSLDEFLSAVSDRLRKDFGQDAALVGEGQWDLATEWMDYNWGWYDPGDDNSAPFHMAFPKAKQSFKCVDDVPDINRIFCSGNYLDLYLEDGGARLAQYPELAAYLKTLSGFKQRFARFLGGADQYLHDMYVEADSPAIRTHAHKSGKEALIMVTHKDGGGAAFDLTIDTDKLVGPGSKTLEIWNRTLERKSSRKVEARSTLRIDLPKNEFVGIHIHP